MNRSKLSVCSIRFGGRGALAALVMLAACKGSSERATKATESRAGARVEAAAAGPPVPMLRVLESGHRQISSELYNARPAGGQATPAPAVDVDQGKLLAGGYPLTYVLEAGQNLFNEPFDPTHGWGEGGAGPRSKQRAVWNPRGGIDGYTAWPFLRVNGIDSQSCFECHGSIGQYTPPGATTVGHVRKPGAQGGPAGAANTAFINDQFPEDLRQLTTMGGDGKPTAVLTKFARNPPVVFGTGYTQQLAAEMTTELMAQQASIEYAAQARPGHVVIRNLISKGQSFGRLTASCTNGYVGQCSVDTSQVTGVQSDLVVRPFQWGGIASSVRHFVKDALDFHFSVQAVEKVGHLDCDGDGLVDELTVGNVTALTAYVTMFRPPYQLDATDPAVMRGRQLLTDVGCTTCHADQMSIDSAIMTIQTPPDQSGDCPQEVATLGSPSGPAGPEAKQQAARRIKRAAAVPSVAAVIATPGATADAIYEAMRPHLHAPLTDAAATDYQLDLNLTGRGKSDAPAYVWPRLVAGGDGKTAIPLYSDLRLHFMGKALSDDYAQPTDAAGLSAQPGTYVTRVLWGVGDTAPYLHDGRARTLLEAVTLHGADGSEAQPVYAKFAALSAADQAALIAFLESQRLPISQGVTESEYAR